MIPRGEQAMRKGATKVRAVPDLTNQSVSRPVSPCDIVVTASMFCARNVSRDCLIVAPSTPTDRVCSKGHSIRSRSALRQSSPCPTTARQFFAFFKELNTAPDTTAIVRSTRLVRLSNIVIKENTKLVWKKR